MTDRLAELERGLHCVRCYLLDPDLPESDSLERVREELADLDPAPTKSTDAAWRADYKAKAKFDATARAIRDLLAEPSPRMDSALRTQLTNAQAALEGRSAHIVAVWD